ncbi:MAG: YgfZ/GcvT domain-containing protein, partial [Endozoicomonas sp.]
MNFDWKAFMVEQGATFDGDKLTGFTNQPESLKSNVVSILNSRGLIRISGQDRQKFLQGQISTNMLQLTAMQHRTGIACNPKGRMYTSFQIIDDGKSYLLSMNRNIVESTIETLKKYAVFFQVELSAEPEYVSLGFSGDDIESILNTSFSLTSLPAETEVIGIQKDSLLFAVSGCSNRFEMLIKPEMLEQSWSSLSERLIATGDNFWDILNIEAVIPEVSEAIIEQYI